MTDTSDPEQPSSSAINEAPDKFVESEQQSSQLLQAESFNKNSETTEKQQQRITFNKESLLQNDDVREEVDNNSADDDENLPEFAKQIPTTTNQLLEEEVGEGDDVDGDGETKVGDNFPLMYAQQ